jgi:hypothetical protein
VTKFTTSEHCSWTIPRCVRFCISNVFGNRYTQIGFTVQFDRPRFRSSLSFRSMSKLCICATHVLQSGAATPNRDTVDRSFITAHVRRQKANGILTTRRLSSSPPLNFALSHQEVAPTKRQHDFTAQARHIPSRSRRDRLRPPQPLPLHLEEVVPLGRSPFCVD